MKPTMIAIIAAALLAGCTKSSPVSLGPEASATFVGSYHDCWLYRVNDEGRTIYLASNTGHYGGCALQVVQ